MTEAELQRVAALEEAVAELQRATLALLAEVEMLRAPVVDPLEHGFQQFNSRVKGRRAS